MVSYNSYIEKFKNPPENFRPVSMWFWNDDMRKDEITFQLEQFKAQGMNDLFINAVWGLSVEYLSDEYFEFVKYTVEECKRLGMRYWIYDEYNWPSGNAGGKLMQKYPWAVGKLLKCESFYCWSGNPANTILTGKLIAAQALFNTGSEYKVIDIMDEVKIEETAGGDTKVSYSSRFNGLAVIQYYFSTPDPHVLTTCVWYKYANYEPGYIDTFNHEAVEKFLELTHERYKEYVGDEFGKTVKGVFTDEICLASPFSIGENKIPWSDKFAEKFKAVNGYDIVPYLYTLFNPTYTKEERKIRNDYFNTAKILYLENFVKPMYDWCDKNNLIFTGHFDGEESLNWHLMQSADLITSMEYMHAPGIDSIVSAHKIDDKNYNVAGKILNSAAKYYNRERTLCETYTGSGWDLRFPLMKRIANRLMVLGVNMIHYMGAYYSWDGFMKIAPTSYPPTHSYNNTLWGHYGKFGDYVSRIQYLSSVTKGASKVLFMTPLVQTKVDLDLSKNVFDYLKDEFCVRYLDEIMESTVNEMLRLNIDLDLISEDGANDINAHDGVMEYRGENYEYMILPNMYYVNSEVADLVDRLDKAGVKIIFINTPPMEVIDSDKTASSGFDKEKLIFENSDASISDIEGKKAKIIKIKNRPLVSDSYREALALAFSKDDVMLGMRTTGKVFTGHRVNDDIEVFIIANDDNAENEVRISRDIKGLEIYNPETGELKELYEDGNDIVIKLINYELVVAVLDKASDKDGFESAITAAEGKAVSITELDSGWTFNPIDENTLACKYEYLMENGSYIPTDYMYFPNGHPVTPNMAFTIRWKFNNDGVDTPVYLNQEIKYVKEIKINGKAIAFERNTRFWGLNNFRAEITELLKNGENVIEIASQLPDWVGIHSFPFGYLSGDFKVNAEGNAISKASTRAVELGSLDEQGYRYFAGKGIFRNSFNAKAGEKISLEFNNEDILKLRINGKDVCERMWKPYKADISDFIVDGKNEIEFEITTTYSNLLGQPVKNGLYQATIIRY